MKRFACALLFLLASVTNLQAQAPFYQGKTIRIIVGNLAGDAYDLWARIFAQHRASIYREIPPSSCRT